MARLLLEVADLSKEIQPTNQQAERVLNNYVKRFAKDITYTSLTLEEFKTMTRQERLDKAVELIREHLIKHARYLEEQEAKEGALNQVDSDPPQL